LVEGEKSEAVVRVQKGERLDLPVHSRLHALQTRDVRHLPGDQKRERERRQ
jgi:hypothetical protein